MAVPVFVGAGAEYFYVPFFGKSRVVQFVSCVKVFFAGDVEHTVLGYKYTMLFELH
jgi:hypothetical protein